MTINIQKNLQDFSWDSLTITSQILKAIPLSIKSLHAFLLVSFLLWIFLFFLFQLQIFSFSVFPSFFWFFLFWALEIPLPKPYFRSGHSTFIKISNQLSLKSAFFFLANFCLYDTTKYQNNISVLILVCVWEWIFSVWPQDRVPIWQKVGFGVRSR